ncbi:MAG: 23S rRNA (pseudouridine(1915)-N(3))-methyltransferase RlmH [Maricaulis sp.]|nr:23S rRNA (pseudouridine(1915)-N(3))-methyltransferase RlmH [Maricaulis sp.]HAQ35787.1 23S rRNA (pseudouridine(1915)-N(3))-methyltransferase RlmH [Alphaproteobacteria bacterium]
MRLTIAAISRIRSGPERDLVDDYLSRATGSGRGIGLGPAVETEIDNRALSDRTAESRSLADAIPPGAKCVFLDERGKDVSARDFASRLGTWRDEGVRETVFVIGGADGLDRSVLPQPDLVLAYGQTVWPHKLVRVMLAEQLYRAVSILAGMPYHRD